LSISLDYLTFGLSNLRTIEQFPIFVHFTRFKGSYAYRMVRHFQSKRAQIFLCPVLPFGRSAPIIGESEPPSNTVSHESPRRGTLPSFYRTAWNADAV